MEDAVTLVHLHYWPATPTRPSTAFSFQLLDWIEAVLLECQVSLSDISAAIEFLHSSGISEVLHNVSARILALSHYTLYRSDTRNFTLVLLMHSKNTGSYFDLPIHNVILMHEHL